MMVGLEVFSKSLYLFEDMIFHHLKLEMIFAKVISVLTLNLLSSMTVLICLT